MKTEQPPNGRRTGVRTPMKPPTIDTRGEANGHCTLTTIDVLAIRKARAAVKALDVRIPSTDPRSLKSLAKRYGLTQAAISRIANGSRWGHV